MNTLHRQAFRFLFSALLGTATAIATAGGPLPGTAAAADASAPAGAVSIDIAVGDVEVGSGNPPIWRAARSGQALRPGDSVRTGERGRAEIHSPRGTIRLFENSLLQLPPPSDGADRVRIDRGSSVFDVHRAADRSFEVHSPSAVVMVKGTRFGVSVMPDGAQVSVVRGLVGVRSLAGITREVLVHPGFTAIGGPGHSFSLSLTPAGADPWQRWSGGDAPALPERVSDVAPERVALRHASDRALERSLHARLGAPVPARAGSPSAPAPAAHAAEPAVPTPVRRAAAGANSGDPINRLNAADSADSRRRMRAAYAIASLTGSTGTNASTGDDGNASASAGGISIATTSNNQVVINSPGLTQTLSQGQVLGVANGNASFPAPLVALLGSYGMTQQAFALQLQALLQNN